MEKELEKYLSEDYSFGAMNTKYEDMQKLDKRAKELGIYVNPFTGENIDLSSVNESYKSDKEAIEYGKNKLSHNERTKKSPVNLVSQAIDRDELDEKTSNKETPIEAVKENTDKDFVEEPTKTVEERIDPNSSKTNQTVEEEDINEGVITKEQLMKELESESNSLPDVLVNESQKKENKRNSKNALDESKDTLSPFETNVSRLPMDNEISYHKGGSNVFNEIQNIKRSYNSNNPVKETEEVIEEPKESIDLLENVKEAKEKVSPKTALKQNRLSEEQSDSSGPATMKVIDEYSSEGNTMNPTYYDSLLEELKMKSYLPGYSINEVDKMKKEKSKREIEDEILKENLLINKFMPLNGYSTLGGSEELRSLTTSDLLMKTRGLTMEQAIEEGFTDGSKEGNIDMRKKLLIDNHPLNKHTVVSERVSPLERKKRDYLSKNNNKELNILGTNVELDSNGNLVSPLNIGNIKNEYKEYIQNKLNDIKTLIGSPFISESLLDKYKEDAFYTDWETQKEINKELNKMDNLSKIISHNSNNNEGKNFMVIDKTKGTVYMYKQGEDKPFYETTAGFGMSKGDAQTVTKVDENMVADFAKGNKMTGAGIYSISSRNLTSEYGAKSFNFFNENGIEVAFALHKGRIRRDPKTGDIIRESNGCGRMDCHNLDELYEITKEGDQVYILPEDEGNRFEFKNNKLAFVNGSKFDYSVYYDSNGVERKGQGINYTNTKDVESTYKPIDIEIPSKESKETYDIGKSIFSNPGGESNMKENIIPYTQSLVDNKKDIMKLTGVSNDDYNDMVDLAIGILGAETVFGTSYKYALKETFPEIVSYLKEKKGNNSFNSKGVTQIKLKGLNEEVRNILSSNGINEEEDLRDPSNAAFATMTILAYTYQNELVGTELFKESGLDKKDALLYLYQGKKKELINKTADPIKNEYIRAVRRRSKDFKIKQRL